MISIIPSSIFNEKEKNIKTKLIKSRSDRNSNRNNGAHLPSHDNKHQSKKSVLDKIYLDIQTLAPCCAVNDNTTLSDRENEPIVKYKNNDSPSTYFEQYVSRIKSHMEPTFKCLVIGDVGVGKTSFVQRYVYQSRIRDYKGTLGG